MVDVAGKKRSFENRISIALSKDQMEFLRKMVEKGEAENISQAVRRCVAIARKVEEEAP